MSAIVRYGLAAFGLALLLALGASTLGLTQLAAWLVAINTVAFLVTAYDKQIAGSQATRIPERVLLALALALGAAGELGAMLLFRHKTHKFSFIWRFLLAAAGALLLLTSALLLGLPLR